jgi:two-component system phosphate regulon sensor histidine kinase PhoR
VVGVVRVAEPLDQVDESVRHLHWLVVLGGATALGVAVLAALVAASLISQRVRELTGVARQMRHGDLGVRARTEGNDEVAELGRVLDQLAASLSQALTELRAERDLMRQVLQGMGEGVLLLGRDGRVALANHSLREMLLLGPDMAGKLPLEVVRNADLQQVLDEVARGEGTVSKEIEIGDIKPRRLLVHGLALTEDPGGTLAVFVDVTDLRRLETLRRDFVANVSHELRTPVTAVRTAAETLRTALDTRPTAARDFVEIIDRNAERLQHLLEDLLDLSRIESRQFRLNLESLELAPVADHIATLFRERAEARGMRLTVDLPPDLGPVRVDRRALEQVLSNLMDNAIKYAGSGAAVTIRATRVEGAFRVFVEDDGVGIEARHLPRVFERFYRVDDGRSRELGGTGLGLSIVKHLVEAMEGTIAVESVLGRGTRFSFTLPRA